MTFDESTRDLEAIRVDLVRTVSRNVRLLEHDRVNPIESFGLNGLCNRYVTNFTRATVTESAVGGVFNEVRGHHVLY